MTTLPTTRTGQGEDRPSTPVARSPLQYQSSLLGEQTPLQARPTPTIYSSLRSNVVRRDQVRHVATEVLHLADRTTAYLEHLADARVQDLRPSRGEMDVESAASPSCIRRRAKISTDSRRSALRATSILAPGIEKEGTLETQQSAPEASACESVQRICGRLIRVQMPSETFVARVDRDQKRHVARVGFALKRKVPQVAKVGKLTNEMTSAGRLEKVPEGYRLVLPATDAQRASH